MDVEWDTLFLAEIGLPPAKLDPPQFGLDVISKIQRNRAHGLAILNSGAMHILDFSVRVIPQPSGATILNSRVPMALTLRSGRKNEIMRMISMFWKISKSGATTARAPLLNFYAPARLNRYPRITDAGGIRAHIDT